MNSIDESSLPVVGLGLGLKLSDKVGTPLCLYLLPGFSNSKLEVFPFDGFFVNICLLNVSLLIVCESSASCGHKWDLSEELC